MANKIRKPKKRSNKFVYFVMVSSILLMGIFLFNLWNKSWSEIGRVFLGVVIIFIGFIFFILSLLMQDKDIDIHKNLDIFGAKMFGFPIFPILWDKTLSSIVSIIILIGFIIVGILVILGVYQ